jgi:hypothetical protein
MTLGCTLLKIQLYSETLSGIIIIKILNSVKTKNIWRHASTPSVEGWLALRKYFRKQKQTYLNRVLPEQPYARHILFMNREQLLLYIQREHSLRRKSTDKITYSWAITF